MVTGTPTRRSKKYPVGEGSQGELRERATQWSCLRYSANPPAQGYDDNGMSLQDSLHGMNVVKLR